MSHIIGIIIGKALGNWQRIDADGNSIDQLLIGEPAVALDEVGP